MEEIKTNNIALAAYIKMHVPLKKKNNNIYTFSSDISIEEWEIRYYNSCCSRHDAELMNLKRLNY